MTRARIAPFLLAAALCAASAAAAELPWVGVSGAGAQLHQEAGAGHHAPGPADLFGTALAAGDFNGDGADDLATGIPGNDCDFVVWDCGSVQIRFGWPTGALGGALTLDPQAAGSPDLAKAFEEYGRALAVGDFDDDGYDDLAVGIPGNFGIDVAWQQSGKLGSVQVHYGLHGSLGSIQPAAEHAFGQGTAEGTSDPHVGERFGAALAVGDFDGDGHDDLAVGAPSDYDEDEQAWAGNVTVFHGHDAGILPFVGYAMTQGVEGLPDAPEADEEFGAALAAGDFNGDAYDDLAIGVPGEDGIGAVLVVYGSQWSLLFANHFYIGQYDIGEYAEAGDRFGAALAVGDFDGDGFDDLAIGAPGEDGAAGQPEDAGMAMVVYGSAAGITGEGSTRLWQSWLHGNGESEDFDHFGSALAAGDFNGDGLDDLAVGAEGENNSFADSGSVTIVLGAASGLAGKLRLARPGLYPQRMIPDVEQGQPGYGGALAVGDFDANGFHDLAIGAPRRDSAAGADTGGVAVLYGHLFHDGFESGDSDSWSIVDDGLVGLAGDSAAGPAARR